MKKVSLKLLSIMQSYYFSFFSILAILFTNYKDFPFMNYSFLIGRKLFFITFALEIILLNYIYQKSVMYLRGNDYIRYQFHLLLIVIWSFLFFTYHEYLLSFLTMLGSYLLLIPLLKLFHKNNSQAFKLSIIYFIWLSYLLGINLLILF